MTVAIKPLRSKPLELALSTVAMLCAAFGMGVILFIVGVSLVKGSAVLSWEFFSSESSQSGNGALFQIIGSLILMLTTVGIAMPVAVAVGITHFAAKSERRQQILRTFLHTLNATPSVILGILGFLFFVKFLGWNKSWFSGGVILSIMILPVVTLSLINRMDTIPKGYIQAAQALGFNPDQIIKSVVLPYSWGGLLTGVVMGVARAAGETAPIMFTAVVFSGATWPTGFKNNPVLALPYHIFNLAQDVIGDNALQAAWASAFVLISFVLFLSVLAIPLRARSHEEAK
jgi:phosphate transport system permease protein